LPRRKISQPSRLSLILDAGRWWLVTFQVASGRLKQSPIALFCYLQKFHKFLTPFAIKTYSFHASRKSRIFDTDMQVVGNYRGLFWSLSAPGGPLWFFEK
jgi:hypothetical protein